ncbi:MAG: DUF5717 family protein [Lachnospiraceae bacterium]|nr:DUF5717 family protein [Lachnospiraceae bacterium]
MQKRIRQLALGKFQQVEPTLSLAPEKIEIRVLEGQNYQGSFKITVTNHKKIRGLVYTSNPYMECLTPEFEGEEVEIRYEFHSGGFVEGDIQKGEFCIICNQIEYNLSFVVSVTKLYAESSVGKIRTLEDFTRLAQMDYREAFRIFISPAFRHILREDQVQQRLYYEGMGRGQATMANMEEFLVASHQKDAVTFVVEEEAPEFGRMNESQQERVFVRKNGWGYVGFAVTSDNDFLRPERGFYSTEDFVGSICEISYYMDMNALHPGKNYGTLIFENAYQRETYQIVVNMSDKAAEEENRLHRQKQQALAELTQYYLTYRMKKMGGGLWAVKTIELLDHLLALNPEESWYRLMKAQAYLISNQRQEAEWILDDWYRENQNRTTPIYAYYLYLCSLRQREEGYINRITEQIEKIYRKSGQDIRVFWILLFLKEEYCLEPVKRLRAIESKIGDGVNSPFFYVELYYLFWQQPQLLVRLGEIERKVLYWAMRHDGLTANMSMQIAMLASTVHGYDPLLYRLMCYCYEKYEQEEMLTALCTYLVRCQRFGTAMHGWYARGIEADLRIAGLNEAYLITMDVQDLTRIPKMVQMYFQYNNTLPYRQKAALIANIILHKEEDPESYDRYRKIMEEFALDQITEGHIDDNLAILYTELLEQGGILGPMARPLAKVVFTYRMNCFSTKAVYMYVIHRQLQTVQKVPLVHGRAYFQLYTKDYAIILEDAKGNRYAGGIPYQIERLIRPRQYYKTCMEFAPDEENYLLYHFSERWKSRMLMPEDGPFFYHLLECEHLRPEFRSRLYPEAVDYYDRQQDQQRVCNLLIHSDLSFLNRKARAYMMEQMIRLQLYDLAYQNVREYGFLGIAPERLVALCNYEIELMEEEGDDFLIILCENTFRNKKYSAQMLQYLARYYLGPTRIMAEIWEEAQHFEVDTYELEERLLVQMLYTAEFVDQIQQIYESHKKRGVTRMLRDAYCNYFSYYYFVREGIVMDGLIPELRQRYLEKEQLTDIMKLALLYGMTERHIIGGDRVNGEIARQLLEELLERQMYFAFYRKLPEELLYQYQLYDRQFVEYRSNPGLQVVIHSGKQGDFVREEMTEMYPGIYVKEYILFFGEDIQYYICEESGDGTNVTESGSIRQQELCSMEQLSRYDLLNRMNFELSMQDYESAEELMKQYDILQQRNETCYHLM